MIPCAIIAVIAIVVLTLSGSAPLGAGIGLTLLLCPLLMGTVMWLLMRQPNGSAVRDDRTHLEPYDHPQHTSGSPHR
jgi:hypothetical protein